MGPGHGLGRWLGRAALAAAVALAGGCAPPVGETAAPAAGPAEGVAVGREIYLHGRGAAGGPVTATLGDGTPLPAAAAACGTCHGPAGRGRPEGGVTPSDVTWGNLSKPYGATHPSGRRVEPYDDRLLIRAVTLGLDSG